MLKLTIAMTPDMIPTHSGVRFDKSESGKTGRVATRNSTKMKAMNAMGKMMAMAKP
jgi:hypothetical protein